jgi:hypothetical protein
VPEEYTAPTFSQSRCQLHQLSSHLDDCTCFSMVLTSIGEPKYIYSVPSVVVDARSAKFLLMQYFLPGPVTTGQQQSEGILQTRYLP